MVDEDPQWHNDLCLLHFIVRVDSVNEGLWKLSAILKTDRPCIALC